MGGLVAAVRPRQAASSRTAPMPETSSPAWDAARRGFSGHNLGTIRNCKNTGAVIGNVTTDGSNLHGPGWACGYNQSASLIKGAASETASSATTTPQGRSDNGPRGHAHPRPSATNSRTTTPRRTPLTGRCRPTTTGVQTDRPAPPGREIHLLRIHQPAAQDARTGGGPDKRRRGDRNLDGRRHRAQLTATTTATTARTSAKPLGELYPQARRGGRTSSPDSNTGFFNSHDGFPRGLHIEEGRPTSSTTRPCAHR